MLNRKCQPTSVPSSFRPNMSKRSQYVIDVFCAGSSDVVGPPFAINAPQNRAHSRITFVRAPHYLGPPRECRDLRRYV
jgi:hypothetical protein